MACGPEHLGSIPSLAKVHNDVIFFLGVFMIQFNLTKFNYIYLYGVSECDLTTLSTHLKNRPRYVHIHVTEG